MADEDATSASAEREVGVWLRRTEENTHAIDALAQRLGGRVDLPVLVNDLNRRVRRTWAPGRLVKRALTWDAADRRDRNWWPQGVSSSADADESGLEHGRRLLMVSWYAKDDQGSRITLVDLERRRYRHVLLVEPTVEDGRPGIKPLEVHAGGIVWHGPYVHVGATGRGIVTCRLDDLLRVPDGAELETRGYRYVLPVRLRYQAETAEGRERMRYSFLSLDRTEEPPHLVAGEYGNRQQSRRLVRFPLDPATFFLGADEGGAIRPAVLHEDGIPRTQGAVSAHGRWHLTTSHGPWTPGSLHTGEPGALRRHRWALPMGPEDLTYWPSTDELWSVTEHPRRRWIVALRRP